MDAIYHYALKLLRRRDYTVTQVRQKLTDRFGEAPEALIELLLKKHFLDDRRFAENFVAKREYGHPAQILTDLVDAGVSREIAEAAVGARTWPSLRDALKATMEGWHLRPPLRSREATRLFRALRRLGYEEEELREELEQLHEQ